MRSQLIETVTGCEEKIIIGNFSFDQRSRSTNAEKELRKLFEEASPRRQTRPSGYAGSNEDDRVLALNEASQVVEIVSQWFSSREHDS